MISEEKLKILVDSAKFDVSCSSSGSNRKNNGGIGNASYGGICHSFTEDGRCVSLLKILMTNVCEYNCLYCVNRRSNDVPRAIATPNEICELTMEFYKHNFIEGLFLSSAVYKNADYTMELLLETVIKLRKLYNFTGYIHLKGIPGADTNLIMRAGEYVDRMSFNLELPSEKSLKLLAPQKSKKAILSPISMISGEKQWNKSIKSRFLPAGQTTQMIIGASPEKDGHILKLTEALYKKYSLKRVYYSSYIPMNLKSNILPKESAGLLREHRLYQADWLIRFYGFKVNELISEEDNLSLDYDPKCAWALSHPELFPVEINTAPVEMLARVPGIGLRSAYKIISARRYGKIDLEGLKRMKIPLKRAINFITTNGFYKGLKSENDIKLSLLENKNQPTYTQLSMFSSPEILRSVLIGEI
ncbi:MAG: putative DNA modification/repair radical SAM protein [Clostridia bacterium]|nr:putative DNA modification/repair radical SAM protein [Clostridia bacterium]